MKTSVLVTVTILLLLSVIIAIITVTVAIVVAEGTAMGPGFLHTTHSHFFRYLALRYLSFWMLSPSLSLLLLMFFSLVLMLFLLL